MEDKELIHSILDGNKNHFEQLVRKYKNLIYSVLCRLVPYDQVDDLAQETFLCIFEKLSQYSEKNLFINWIYTIALNKARGLIRKNNIKRKIKSVFLAEYEQSETYFSYFDKNQNDENELLELLNHRIRTLSFHYQQVIILFYNQDLKIEQIAAILNQKENTIKTWLKRAKEKLSQHKELKYLFETILLQKQSTEKGG